MPSPLSTAAPSSIVRVLDFMRQKEHHALLDADAGVCEVVAVHAVLSFVRLLRTGLKRKRGVSWLPKDANVSDRVCEDAVASMALRRVAPRQLVEGGTAPLRRLLLEAVQPAKVVYLPCVRGALLRPWGEWLVQLLGVPPSDCCCTRVALHPDDVTEAVVVPVELRFLHGRFPTVEGLSRGGMPKARASAYAAALAGHTECLRFLRSIGVPFTDRTPHGCQAMHAAVFNDDVPMMQLIHAFDPSAVNRVTQRVETPAMVAAAHGRMKSLVALHDLGADFRAVTRRGSAAYAAASHNQAEALDFVLRSGGSARRYVSYTGDDAVRVAVQHGYIDCLRIMHANGVDLDHGARLGDFRPKEFPSPAYTAAHEGRLEVLQFLRRIDVNLRWLPAGDDIKHLPIYAAASEGHVHCMRFLCDECPGAFTTQELRQATLAAAQRQHLECLRLGFEHGVLEILTDRDRADFVHAAVQFGGVSKAACLRYVADLGFDLSCRDADGRLPAHSAAQWGRTAALRVLIEKGADVTSVDSKGETPLYCAAGGGYSSLDCLALLLPFGGLHVADHRGWTPVHRAAACLRPAWDWDTLQMLKDAGADMHKCTASGVSPLALMRYSSEDEHKWAKDTLFS